MQERFAEQDTPLKTSSSMISNQNQNCSQLENCLLDCLTNNKYNFQPFVFIILNLTDSRVNIVVTPSDHLTSWKGFFVLLCFVNNLSQPRFSVVNDSNNSFTHFCQ